MKSHNPNHGQRTLSGLVRVTGLQDLLVSLEISVHIGQGKAEHQCLSVTLEFSVHIYRAQAQPEHQ